MSKFTLSFSVLAATALAGCQIEEGTLSDAFGTGDSNGTDTAHPHSYSLQYSQRADRSSGTSVQDVTLDQSGQYYFYLDSSNTDAESVQFYLNNSLVHTDTSYPYDLNGGTRASAYAQDMSWFKVGDNTLMVKVDGEIVASSSLVVETEEVVVGPEPEPEPTPEPEPEPTPEPEPEPTQEPTPEPDPITLSVTLYWSAPMQRENGTDLTTNELGGYEIRYRQVGDTEYQSVVINDATVDQHYFDGLPDGDYEFQIAAFDTEGLYSEFVTAQ